MNTTLEKPNSWIPQNWGGNCVQKFWMDAKPEHEAGEHCWEREAADSWDQLLGFEFPGIPPLLGAAPGNIFNIHGTFSAPRTARYGWMLWTL